MNNRKLAEMYGNECLEFGLQGRGEEEFLLPTLAYGLMK